jgi:membrane fusion protein, macrolide-specific efflux system
MKLIISLVAILGLSAGGYVVWKKAPHGADEVQKPGRPTTATVEPRDIEFAVSAAGDIGPADQVSVRPEINGRIEELPVDIGDKVKKGDLLCRLDDRDLQIERSQQLTAIDGAKLQLQKATRNFARSRQLHTDKLISQEVFDDCKTDYDLATNALDRAEQALRLVDDKLRKTRILAPFDCTVLTRPVSLGQTVSGSAGFNSGTEIMSIANLNDMVVNAHVNQADVIRLQQGRDVEIQAESVPGVRMRGVVERIAPQAVIKNGIKGFSARIAIKDIDQRVRPGMTAILSIPVSSADNVLAVPLAAVFTERGERFVFVKNEDQFERRNIVLGVTDYAYAEVVQGLSPGEVVSLEQKVNNVPGVPSSPGSTSGTESKKGVRRAEAATTIGSGIGSRSGGSSGSPATPRPAARATGS